jgi:putative lipoprotein
MKQIMILVGMVSFLVACSQPNVTPTPTVVPTTAPATIAIPTESAATPMVENNAPIENVTWQLTQLNGKPITQSPAPTILFANMMSISGEAFCNSYSGNYEGSAASIIIGNIASTKKACADTTLMDLESEYFATITNSLHITATTDTLTIYGTNQTPLAIFTKK